MAFGKNQNSPAAADSEYTRIHVHFFGASVGKKAEIKRCPVLVRDQVKYNNLFKKVKEVEDIGVSKSLKNSVLSKNASSKKRIEESFWMLERNVVDMKIIRGLCANGIPFNVLHNPHFLEMINAIKKTPDGYKPPSCEKARTVLLDECVRDVEKDLSAVKDTWYTQGVSIVLDGWSNVKHKPLINVLAVNARGAMFMYAEDYSGVEKTGVAISKFLLGAIETVGPSNVLQVVTDNAANCKAAGREIEKVREHARKLLEKRMKKPFFDVRYGKSVERMSPEDLVVGKQWLSDTFHLIRCENDCLPSISWVLDLAKAAVLRHGVNGLVIDPYNELDHQRPSNQTETEYVSQMLTSVKRFAQHHSCHVWFVAHPKQLQQWTGKPPNLYDISGSAHFINKCDNGIVIHRNRDPEEGAMDQVQICVRKVRNKVSGTIGDAFLTYNRVTGEYLDIKKPKD